LFFGGIGAGHPVLNAWASRTRHFSRISVTQVTGTITSTLGKLAFGIFGFNSGGGLIAGSLFGSVVSPLLLGWQIWKENYILFKQSIRLPIIWENLKRYRKFAMYNTPSSLLNTLSWQVPSFLLAFFFSPIVVGYYAFGNQLLRLPMNLIGGSIAQAFYSHAATAHKDGKLAEFVEDTFRRLVDYSFLPLLTLTFIGRELCVVIFGSEWAEAGVYIQILSVWTFFWFISGPMARLFNILEKNEFPFWMNIIQIVLRVIAIWLGGMMGSPRLSLLFFSIVGVVLAGYVSTTIILIAGVPGRKIGEIFLKNSLFLIPVGIILMTLKLLHISDWLQLAAATILVCVYYYRFVDEIKLRLMNISFFKNIIKTK
jgi:O-antigen/teichoic acid export membrane protein